ncbi:glycosyltransferase family 4 protein [Lentibacter algarum]|uniref:glycosyltransferase family 4 protein n=1 Tax=Lentibacter algarum TaxID=576131 RepID=UPI001C074561|nr:glycosyltransferase family 1 protein [Lentibacter algarum]MBU2981053.1 glycosyltransferase family 4 protein [Lentibacter algarum]
MTSDAHPARLLDLTRLISRAGRTVTGVDRVERAYLDALMQDDVPLWGLIKTPLGFLLLDEAGLRQLSERFDGKISWGRAAKVMRLASRLDARHLGALADARKLAKARCTRRRLATMLKAHLPTRTTYLNTGHSNYSDAVVHGVRAIDGARIAVFVHDTIPLDHASYQTPEAVERFRDFLKRVSATADLVIYNSAATRATTESYFAEYARTPKSVVAHLGVDLPVPDASQLPKGMPPMQPYFVCVGTLEPRKNHSMLLKIWERLEKQTPPQDMPELLFCGRRGWMNEEFFFKFDNSRLKGVSVHELGGLSDEAIAALLEGAAGVLFPSLVEGYGLPVMEAAAKGVPVICPELPVYREVLKDIPVYASVNDSYLWIRRIMALSESKQTGREASSKPFKAPTWAAHFNLVLSEI